MEIIPLKLEYGKIMASHAILVHNALHDEAKPDHIIIPNEYSAMERYDITIASNGCRKLIYNNITFMQQNKSKASKYAQLAREGHKITWGMRDKYWIYIIDGIIK